MAVTENMLVNVQVKTGNSTNDIDQLAGVMGQLKTEITNLNSTLLVIGKTLRQTALLNKELMTGFAKSASIVNSTTQKLGSMASSKNISVLNEQLKTSESNLNKLETSAKKTNKSITDLEDGNSEFVKSLKESSSLANDSLVNFIGIEKVLGTGLAIALMVAAKNFRFLGSSMKAADETQKSGSRVLLGLIANIAALGPLKEFVGRKLWDEERKGSQEAKEAVEDYYKTATSIFIALASLKSMAVAGATEKMRKEILGNLNALIIKYENLRVVITNTGETTLGASEILDDYTASLKRYATEEEKFRKLVQKTKKFDELKLSSAKFISGPFKEMEIAYEGASKALFKLKIQGTTFESISKSVTETLKRLEEVNRLQQETLDPKRQAESVKRSMDEASKIIKDILKEEESSGGKILKFPKKEFNSFVSSLNEFDDSFSKAEISAAKMSKSVFMAAKNIGIMIPMLIAVGTTLEKSENEIISFIGNVVTWTGIAMGGISAIIGLISYAVGDFLMEWGLARAKATEADLKLFEQTQKQFDLLKSGMQSLSKKYVKDVVGSYEEWLAISEKLFDQSIYNREEIVKSINLIITKSKGLGFNFQTSAAILRRSADLAADANKGLYETVENIFLGITGNNDVLNDYNISLEDAQNKLKEFSRISELGTNQLDDNQMALVRLAYAFKQTEDVAGTAKLELENVDGAMKRLANSIETINLRIGKGNWLLRAWNKTVDSIGESFANLAVGIINAIPKKIIEAFGVLYGTTSDIMSLFLILSGVILKTIAIVLTLVGVFYALRTVIVIVTGSTITMTGTILLFAKSIALPIAAILALTAAFSELYDETTYFRQGVDQTFGSLTPLNASISSSEKAITRLTSAISYLLRKLIDVAKFMITGLLEASYLVSYSFVKLKSLFSNTEDEEVYVLMLEELNGKMRETYLIASELVSSFIGDEQAVANIKKIKDELSDTDIVMEQMAFNAKKFKEEVIKQAKEINKNLDIQHIKTSILGTDTERLISDYKSIVDQMRNINKLNLDLKASAEEYAKLEVQRLEKAYEIQKSRLTTMKEIEDSQKRLNSEILKMTGNNIKAIKLETNEQLDAIDEQINSMFILGTIQKDDLKKALELKAAILKSSDLKIQEERLKYIDKALGAEKLLSDIKKDTAVAEGKAINELIQKQKDRFAEIDKMEADLRKSNDFGARARLALDQAREAALKIVIAGRMKLEKEALADLKKRNEEIQNSYIESELTTQQQILRRYNAEMEVLRLKEEELKAQGLLNDEMQTELDMARLRLDYRREKESAAAPGSTFDAMAMAGKDAAASISSVFTNGALELIGGGMSMVGSVIDAVSAVLDAIPNFLNKISDFIDKLVEFPNILLSAIQKLSGQLTKFVEMFFQQLVAVIPQIVNEVIDLLIKIPDIIDQILTQLPVAFEALIEKAPEMAQTLTRVLITNMPKIAKSLWMFSIRAMPEIAKQLALYLGFELPKAIFNGIIDSLQQITGEIPAIGGKNIAANMKLSMQQAAQTLTGEASKLFAVMDLAEAAKAEDKAKEMAGAISEAISENIKKGADYLTYWWRKIWDWILQQWDGLVAVWRMVWDWILQLWDGLVAVWRIVWDWIVVIWRGIVELLQSAWNGIVVLWNDMIGVLQQVWDTLVSTWYVVIDYLKTIWDSVITALQSLWDTLLSIFQNMLSGLSSIGQFIWDGLKSALENGMDFFTSIGGKIWDGLKTGLNGIGDFVKDIFDGTAFTNLFERMFTVDMGGKGTVEKALGIDVPFMSFAKGGILSGNAITKGDSELNDRILALLSPGEAIIPRSLMNDRSIRSIVEAILAGKISPNKYFGGSFKIGGTNIGVSDKGVTINDKSVGEGLPKSISDVIDPLNKIWDEVRKQTYAMIWKMFDSNKFHGGGMVGFANGGEVPALLESGEFVINKKSSMTNYDLLNRINSGKQSNVSPNITLNIDIKTTEPIDDAYFRNRLIPKIKDEFKRASLDGQFLISKRGIM